MSMMYRSLVKALIIVLCNKNNSLRPFLKVTL